MNDALAAARSVPEILAAAVAAADPDAPSLVAADGTALSFADLGAALTRLRGELRRLGVGRQDRVVVLLPNGAGEALLLLALLDACAAAPVNPHTPDPEFRALVERIRPRALLACPAQAEQTAAVAADLGLPLLRVAVGPGPFAVALAGEPVGPPAPETAAAADDIAALISTSGTSGRAKIVVRAHRNLVAAVRPELREMGLRPGDRTLLLPPFVYAYGQHLLLRSVIGGTAIVCPDPTLPEDPAGLVARFDPTWLQLAPAMLAALLPTLAAGAAPSLRVVRCGSTDFPDALRQRVATALGIPLHNAYGLSEATHLTFESAKRPHRPGTVGPLFREVRVAGDDGRPLPEGKTGEIQTRGDHVVPGYWDDPDLTARAFPPDGWFRTGDRGRIVDGYLELAGRTDDVINRGGSKVDPQAVEAVLTAHPAVAEAAVFAIPDSRLGQEVAAAVVLRPGATASPRELRRWLLDRVEPDKVPRKVRFVEALPRNANGKVSRRALAEAEAHPGPSTTPPQA